jgi:lysophospholipase L1-like esterase
MRLAARLCGAACLALILVAHAPPASARTGPRWVATWMTSPIGSTDSEEVIRWNEANPRKAWRPASLLSGTLRYRLRIAKGGEELRLTIANTYPRAMLRFAAMSVGVAGKGLDADPATLRQVEFGGAPGMAIPAGARAISDPVDLPVRDGEDLIVSIYIPEGISVLAYPPTAEAPLAAIAAGANQMMSGHLRDGELMDSRTILSEVDVLTRDCRGVVVALGDSITDGNVYEGVRGWPGVLAPRLAPRGLAVVNAGIGGNRVLSPQGPVQRAMLARLDEDVLVTPGITDIILLEGINDIGGGGTFEPYGEVPPVSAAELIAAYRQVITEAHLRHLKVIGATLLPFAGAFYYSPAKDAIRRAVNHWIRTSGAFDGVIDFAAALRDPAAPERIRADLTVDHLHPNGAGYRLMGEAIDLRLFE